MFNKIMANILYTLLVVFTITILPNTLIALTENIRISNVSIATSYLTGAGYQVFGAGVSTPTGRAATITIAAANASTLEKSQADYVCSGSNDSAQLQAAITAGAGGMIILSSGRFNMTSNTTVPANTTVTGSGELYNVSNKPINLLMIAGNNVTIEGLRFDGNRANNNSGDVHSINNGVYSSPVTSANLTGTRVLNCLFKDMGEAGVRIAGNANTEAGRAKNTVVEHCHFDNCYSSSINLTYPQTSSVVSCTFVNDDYRSIEIEDGNTTTVTENAITLKANKMGIELWADSCTATSNTIYAESGASTFPIYVGPGGEYNTVSSNTIRGNGAGYGITLVTDANSNTIGLNNIYNISNGIFVYEAHANNVLGNTIVGSTEAGIRFDGDVSNPTTHNWVQRNDLQDCTIGIWEHTDNVTDQIYSGNRFYNCSTNISAASAYATSP